MTGPIPPTVEKGMREAVFRALRDPIYFARYPASVVRRQAAFLCAGPIASALAARERELEEARGLAERLGFELEMIGTENDELEEQAEEDARTIASLRTSAERMEADHAEEIARLKAALNNVEGKCELARSVYATERTATPSRAADAFAIVRDVARAALTPKEPHDG